MNKTSATPNGKVRVRLDQLLADYDTNIATVSRLTGISVLTLYALRDNKSKGISFDIIAALMEYFGCSIGALLSYEV